MSIQNGIYYGIRGDKFKQLITKVLRIGNLKEKYIKNLTDDEAMAQYSKAFTAASANSTENYEVFEQLGDVTANKFIVWYAYRRYPFLMCPKGVKVVSRLKGNYGSKASFHKIAEELGFWPFISAKEEQPGEKPEKGMKYRRSSKKGLLEDTLEAFCGATEYILDNRYRQGVGSSIVYDILKPIFDKMKISLKYIDLYDSKTYMKEIFDKEKIGTWKMQIKKDVIAHLNTVKVIFTDNNRISHIMGTSVLPNQKDAEQQAAKKTILMLNNKGYKKHIPPEYEMFERLAQQYR